jgi:protein-tyrosine phosphatase
VIKSVLFVCLGNICRSPTAECIFREKAKISKLDIFCDSAGTASWHVGSFPYQPMQLAAKNRGFDMSQLRARQIKIADFNEFDLLVVMDQENRSNLQNLCPEQSDKVHLLTDYSLEDLEYDYVPDPYYTRNFNQTLDIIEASLNGLVESVRNHNNK